jgi:hypothetical protein
MRFRFLGTCKLWIHLYWWGTWSSCDFHNKLAVILNPVVFQYADEFGDFEVRLWHTLKIQD